MSHWNHRVFKEPCIDPLACDDEWFTIREVYYNDNGDIVAYGSAKNVGGESIESLRTILNWMLSCLDKPVLVEGEFEMVEDFDVEDEDVG